MWEHKIEFFWFHGVTKRANTLKYEGPGVRVGSNKAEPYGTTPVWLMVLSSTFHTPNITLKVHIKKKESLFQNIFLNKTYCLKVNFLCFFEKIFNDFIWVNTSLHSWLFLNSKIVFNIANVNEGILLFRDGFWCEGMWWTLSCCNLWSHVSTLPGGFWEWQIWIGREGKKEQSKYWDLGIISKSYYTLCEYMKYIYN